MDVATSQLLLDLCEEALPRNIPLERGRYPETPEPLN